MALTLPYPSMVFVPLDVLTAEEMNQIVANYEAIAGEFPIKTANIDGSAVTTAKIASKAVTTAKIDDDAVTADKLDWSSLAQTVSVGANSTTSITFDPNCIYLVMYTVIDQSGMFLVQARANTLFVNDMTQPQGYQAPATTTSGLTLTLATWTEAMRIVAVKAMGDVSW